MRMRLPSMMIGLWALGGCTSTDSVEAKAAEPRIHVETVIADKRAVPQEVQLTGVLAANERTELAANAAGRVTRVFVELGQRVPAGAALAQLDSRTAQLAAREANANVQQVVEQLSTLRKDCDRYAQLLEKGVITQQIHDRAVGQCQTQSVAEAAARVRVEQANQNVTDSTVRAPFAGKIADRYVHVGDYVRPDSRVVTLLSDDPLRLRLTVPETAMSSVKPELAVRFESASAPERSHTAIIKYVGGEIRAQTRDLVVEAIVDNAEGKLLPGMFVTAHLPTGTRELPLVAREALVAGTTPSVFIVEGERVRQRILQLGPPVGDAVSVTDGLRGGERVVLHPANTLSDGALVH
jgi:membrane fusion protein (multidrug efflux system)